MTDVPGGVASLARSERRTHTFTVTVPADAEPTRPYFVRSRTRRRAVHAARPVADGTACPAASTHGVGRGAGGWRVVHRAGARDATRGEPAVGVRALSGRDPATRQRRAAPSREDRPRRPRDAVVIDALVSSHASRPIDGSVELKLPAGWTSSPERAPFSLDAAGASQRITFSVHTPGAGAEAQPVTAAAHVGGRVYSDEVEAIRYRDLPVQYLYREARALVRSVDVAVAPGLTVGYVMGVGDEVPAAIAQLGASVQLLAEPDLASGDLARFDTIVTGTRAYAVRADLERTTPGSSTTCDREATSWSCTTRRSSRRRHRRPTRPHCRLTPKKYARRTRRSRSSRRTIPCCRNPTGSAQQTSTAGSSSAGRSSSRAGTRGTSRCCRRTTVASRRSAAACCTPASARGTIRTWRTRCTGSCRQACRGPTGCLPI